MPKKYAPELEPADFDLVQPPEDGMTPEAEPQPVPDVEPQPVPPPQAVFIFDLERAAEWLAKSWLRLRGRIKSARFEPEGIKPKQVQFALLMLAASIKAKGVLYVPQAFADSKALEGLERAEAVGDYVAFRKP